MENDTIAAISTPIGSGGIGIIKISGKNALSIATSIFKRSSNKFSNISTRIPKQSANSSLLCELLTNELEKDPIHFVHAFQAVCGGELQSHLLYHGNIINPENEQPIDEVLLSVMKAPHSYTKEDVVEINVHSGLVVLRTILDLVLSKGARLAEPGEFTKRAFLNGRIDLTQAEAVIDLINAKSRKALEVANAQAGGDLRFYIQNIIKALTDILIKIDAAIDFPEDVGIVDLKTVKGTIERDIIQPLEKLIAGYDEGHVLREGLKVVITGRPNVGKSSLMNQLLKKEHAIVTSFPGTTRDILEETLIISGIHTIITDTAGLHDSKDPVEMIGMEKTREKIKNADIILFMVDAVTSFIKTDYEIYEFIKERPLILVINKIDLVSEDFEIKIIDELKRLPVARISALYNIGIDSLKEKIKNIFNNKTGYCSSNIIPNIRQKKALEKSLNSVELFVNGLESGLPFEIVSIDIKDAVESLKEVLGLKIKEDILDQIFSQFCIGK
ncbi:MAG: tRNA uridine-5-carboxymethylaminomethyl(34) synthesis GTPase MnmE [Desulfobacterales bacterium]